jgi:hypothetical protein
MDGICARSFSSFDDLVHPKIRLGGGRRAYQYRLVSIAHVKGIPVCLAINGHRFDPHFPGRSHHPEGNFSSVSDQNFADFYHKQGRLRNSKHNLYGRKAVAGPNKADFCLFLPQF